MVRQFGSFERSQALSAFVRSRTHTARSYSAPEDEEPIDAECPQCPDPPGPLWNQTYTATGSGWGATSLRIVSGPIVGPGPDLSALNGPQRIVGSQGFTGIYWRSANFLLGTCHTMTPPCTNGFGNWTMVVSFDYGDDDPFQFDLPCDQEAPGKTYCEPSAPVGLMFSFAGVRWRVLVGVLPYFVVPIGNPAVTIS